MNKKYATGVVNPKTTAIFFDELWIPYYGIFLDEEERDYFSQIPEEVIMTFTVDKYKDKLDSIFRYAMIKNSNFNEFDLTHWEYTYSKWRNKSLLYIAKTLQDAFKIDIIPIFYDKTEFENSLHLDCENETITKDVIEFVIKDMPIILEKELEWDQVIDFRNDKKCVDSARKLMRWVRLECNGLTKSNIKEKLEEEFDEYLFSIKKHGIQITTGALSTILASSSSIVDMINGNSGAFFIGAASISAALITYTVDRVISNLELRRSPVACIYNLKKI